MGAIPSRASKHTSLRPPIFPPITRSGFLAPEFGDDKPLRDTEKNTVDTKYLIPPTPRLVLFPSRRVRLTIDRQCRPMCHCHTDYPHAAKFSCTIPEGGNHPPEEGSRERHGRAPLGQLAQPPHRPPCQNPPLSPRPDLYDRSFSLTIVRKIFTHFFNDRPEIL